MVKKEDNSNETTLMSHDPANKLNDRFKIVCFIVATKIAMLLLITTENVYNVPLTAQKRVQKLHRQRYPWS